MTLSISHGLCFYDIFRVYKKRLARNRLITEGLSKLGLAVEVEVGGVFN